MYSTPSFENPPRDLLKKLSGLEQREREREDLGGGESNPTPYISQ